MDARHIPVLLAESLAWLAPERGGTFLDATLGLGGHAEALLDAAPAARLVGADRDPQALALAAARLARFADRVELVEADFGRLEERVGHRAPFAGVLADLGVSSLQLDTAGRGFSFRREGPLDMRMGRGGSTAADLVSTLSEAELTDIFRQYGEEPQARRVARAIVEARAERPIATTADLADVVRSARRPMRGEERIDPATRVFQALRIAVNEELDQLSELLDQAVRMLDHDGRLVVISYHSLEDREVKNRFRDLARGEVDPITGRTHSETRILEVLTRKPVRPGEAEVDANPRSRSARLRASRRL
ncbi:MAG: 16S rRNA (cytosine(1402)-N(4))-methyltransferase RsmH [Thermoanaerobaculia bacterium]|nr:MAG: 16S rRNA (cytosine(1402)-N(4))-methyltransferase RsmH [Thermoanaerobaculia bacterium]MBZ0100604.1 16S rRNA (cytosine(1402)-N(4))-methyltransferase RsmH [Thermoanaerobaculia bacterium]